MIQGTAWTKVNVSHDEDEATEYDIRVAYEYEYISHRDPYFQQVHSHIEVIEWPEGISENTKAMINNKLGDVLADLLEPDDQDEWEQSFEND